MTSFMEIFSWHLKKMTPVTIILMSWLLIDSIRINEPILETIDIGLLIGIWILMVSVMNLIWGEEDNKVSTKLKGVDCPSVSPKTMTADKTKVNKK